MSLNPFGRGLKSRDEGSVLAVIKVENEQGGGVAHTYSIIPFNPVLRVTISFI